MWLASNPLPLILEQYENKLSTSFRFTNLSILKHLWLVFSHKKRQILHLFVQI